MSDTKQPISAEQAADLAAIQAAINEAPAQAAAGSLAEPVKTDLNIEFAGLIKLAVAALSPAFPSLKDIYTDEVTAAAATAAAAVCNKHNWLQSGVGGKWSEEIAAAAILLPLSWQTYQGITADLAKSKASQPAEKKQLQASEPTSSAGLSFGEPVEPELNLQTA